MNANQNPVQKRYLFLVSFIAALGGFLFGFDTAVISGVLSFVVNQFHFNTAMEGWFVSCALLGCVIGVAVAGTLSDRYGRKLVMLLSALLFFISSVGCMFALDASMLIWFRFVGGLGIGVASMICPLYISEFSPPQYRGRLVALYQLAITIGIVAAYFSNAYLLHFSQKAEGLSGMLHFVLQEDVWRSMIGIGLVPAFIFLVSLLFVPESPRWLVLKGREEKALVYLKRLNPEAVAVAEINAVKAIAEDKGNYRQLFSKAYRTPLLIGLFLPFLTQVSGINAVIYYGPVILDKAGFSLGDALGGQVVVGLVNVLFTFVAILTVDKYGRRPLLLWGVTGAVLSLAILGVLFNAQVTSGPWILMFILLFIACFAFSFGPVCFILIGEIFPNASRGLAMSLATLSLWVANFLVGQMTPFMLKSDSWGPAATFWTFALLCAPALWLTWKVIPETKGQTLEDIQRYWKKNAIH
jgi:SP family arabinose:H+ symporter-like MFS transporter